MAHNLTNTMLNPSPSILQEIAQRLARPIPPPMPRKVKPQDSWRTLKTGQWLRLLERWVVGATIFESGCQFEIVAADSGGVWMELRPDVPAGKDVLTSTEPTAKLRWTVEDWKATFERVRKPKASK